jgi:hypothetical protein
MLFSNISKNDFMLFMCCQEKKMKCFFNNYPKQNFAPIQQQTRIKMNTNTESDYESDIGFPQRDIDDIDMDEVMGCSCGEILSIYNEYGLFSGTCPKCGETWGNPTFKLPQDCFNIVKDYMGIVSVPNPIRFDQDILIEQLNKCGIDKLCLIYGNEFKRRMTNMKCSSIPLEKRKNTIIGAILKQFLLIEENVKDSVYRCILDKYFAPKQKKVKDNSWVNDFNVNEEVIVYHDENNYRSIFRKAIVKKINKASVSVLLAMYREEDDLNAIKNQTYGYNKLIWGGWCLKTIPIKSRSRLHKKGDEKYNSYINEGQRWVDYGN